MRRIKSNPLAFFVILIHCLFASADSSSINELEFNGFAYHSSKPPTTPYQYQMDWKWTYENKFSSYQKFIFKMNYVADPGNSSNTEQHFFDIPELNLKIKSEEATWRLGSEIVSWGVTDGFNPLDLINTKNYFDPIHSRKLGAFTLGANHQRGNLETDVVLIPKARPAQLPGTNSRWLPRSVYTTQSPGQNMKLILPQNLTYSYNYAPVIDRADEVNLAARLLAHLESWDLGFYLYDGIAPLPAITPTVTGTVLQISPVQIIQVDPDVTLKVQNYRQKTVGFSFIRSFSSWQLKGASSYTQPDSGASTLASWSHDSVLAAEKQFALSSDGQITAVLQIANIRRPGTSGNDLTSISRFFDSNMMAGIHYMWRDSHTLIVFMSYDFIYNSMLLELKHDYRINDRSKVGWRATAIDGPSESPMGTYAGNKSIGAFYQLTF